MKQRFTGKSCVSISLIEPRLTDHSLDCSHILNAEDVNNSLVAIQPTLMSYGLDSEPSPVLLDSVSIQDNTILLLDTFFHILIFHGATIAQWRKAGYHEQEDYANLKELLQRPKDDAAVGGFLICFFRNTIDFVFWFAEFVGF
jgi:hypothetical protein